MSTRSALLIALLTAAGALLLLAPAFLYAGEAHGQAVVESTPTEAPPEAATRSAPDLRGPLPYTAAMVGVLLVAVVRRKRD